jgi:hypothetical protein
METTAVKEGILKAFKGIVDQFDTQDIEDIQDLLSIQLHKLTDDGDYVDIDDVLLT